MFSCYLPVIFSFYYYGKTLKVHHLGFLPTLISLMHMPSLPLYETCHAQELHAPAKKKVMLRCGLSRTATLRGVRSMPGIWAGMGITMSCTRKH